MASCLKAKERILLLNSEVIKQYPEAIKIIEENDKITEEFIASLPEKQRNFFENMLPNILKQAISEWKGNPKMVVDMGTDRSKWMRCSLDNRENRYIFYITNQLNGKSINVGSECIKYFWDSWYGNYEGKSIDQLIKDATRLKLLSDLNDKIPGIERTIENWDNLVNNCDIILPRALEDPYLKLGKEASFLLEQYLNEKLSGNYEEKFNEILDQRKVLIDKINKYIKQNASNMFVPKKEVRTWLKSRGRENVIEMLKNDGVITWRTAHRIEEPMFMDSIVPYLNKGINTLGLQLTKVDKNRNGYVIQTLGDNTIDLFSKHRELIIYCGWLLFNEKPIEEFSLEGFLKFCSLNSEKDIDTVLKALNALSLRSEIRIENPDFEFNEVAVFDYKEGKYVLAAPISLAEKFKGLVIGTKDIRVSDLISYVKSLPGPRYTKKEFDEYRGIRKEFNRKRY